MVRGMRYIYKLVLLALFSIFTFGESVTAQNVKGAGADIEKQSLDQLQKLMYFYRYLSNLYVEEVDMQPLIEEAIRAMLAELDPHSRYLDVEEMKSLQETTKGEFGGIGVEFNILNDSIIVVNTFPQGPAESVGVMPNDRIVEVEGKSVVGVKRSEVPKLLRGERGSVVKVGVVRHGVADKLNFSIIRGDIPLTTVDAAYRVDDNIGYVKVNRFGHTTMTEFRKAMEKLSGVNTLILDLSNNGGGLLNQAVDMAGYFLPKGSLVVSTEGRALPSAEYKSKGEQEFKGRVIVLVNEISASGSEVVAGALQDWDRAVIVGRRSYGKGLVQREIPLGDGSAVHITIARYHTPSGRVIQRPYEQGKKDEYDRAFIERVKGGDADSLVRDSVEEYKTMRLGRSVYGGGGITPDVRVVADTTRMSDYVASLIAQGVYAEYVIEYLDKNRSHLKEQYPTFAKFNTDFRLSDEELLRVVEVGKTKNVAFDEAGFEHSRELMRNQLSAMIAQRLFTQSEYFEYINSRENDSFKKAISIAGKWEFDALTQKIGPK